MFRVRFFGMIRNNSTRVMIEPCPEWIQWILLMHHDPGDSGSLILILVPNTRLVTKSQQNFVLRWIIAFKNVFSY